MKAFCLCLSLLFLGFVSSDTSFVYNGFLKADLSLDGASQLRSNGILSLTNDSVRLIGHAFYPSPIHFKRSKDHRSWVVTFSTNFVFSMAPKYPGLGGHGLAFVLLSTKAPMGCLPNQYLGLPNVTSNADFSTRVLAVEFDAVQNLELMDINDNHVGIDISSLISNVSKPAAYYFTNNSNNSIAFKSGDPIQAWIEYNSQEQLMNVTISPLGIPKSFRPLISFPIDLSMVLNEYMYIGFSASTGLLTAAHNVHGWSFRIGGRAADLDPLRLPSPVTRSRKVLHQRGLTLGIILASATLVILVISGTAHVVHRIRNKEEVLEEWEVEYGAHRFKYSDLFSATRGFREKNLIGSGGFGRVYKGIIPRTGLEVAIKRVAHDSRQGMKEFVAEIISMGRLRHRNLVQLHGWCRRQDELILVYDYVPNGSLDKILYKILIGVSQALLYLHEECDQRVVHRDVKPSNVLIDAELNARLGDFGLARMYKHGNNPETTHIVGTLGYLAPELTRIGKATTSTDVYAYGVLMLEVATGRRPIEPQRNAQELVLMDWVRELHSRGEILSVIDPTLDEYNPDEAKLVLSLGLLCSHPHPDYRPDMRRVIQYLLKDVCLPELPPDVHLEVPGTMIEFSDTYPDA
ncbi:hypothetical protein AAG906_035386 [Vitis piasezkii]